MHCLLSILLVLPTCNDNFFCMYYGLEYILDTVWYLGVWCRVLRVSCAWWMCGDEMTLWKYQDLFSNFTTSNLIKDKWSLLPFESLIVIWKKEVLAKKWHHSNSFILNRPRFHSWLVFVKLKTFVRKKLAIFSSRQDCDVLWRRKKINHSTEFCNLRQFLAVQMAIINKSQKLRLYSCTSDYSQVTQNNYFI